MFSSYIIMCEEKNNVLKNQQDTSNKNKLQWTFLLPGPKGS